MTRRVLSVVFTFGIAIVALLFLLPSTSAAPTSRSPDDAVVGDGTPASCTDTALQTALRQEGRSPLTVARHRIPS